MEKQRAEEPIPNPIVGAAELQRHFNNKAGLVALEPVLVFSLSIPIALGILYSVPSSSLPHKYLLSLLCPVYDFADSWSAVLEFIQLLTFKYSPKVGQLS